MVWYFAQNAGSDARELCFKEIEDYESIKVVEASV
jgi:hypothetical protein